MGIQRKRQTQLQGAPHSLALEAGESAKPVHECSMGMQSAQGEEALNRQPGASGQDS